MDEIRKKLENNVYLYIEDLKQDFRDLFTAFPKSLGPNLCPYVSAEAAKLLAEINKLIDDSILHK